MKADGITLSTVGAGGGANPFLAAAREAGRRPVLRRRRTRRASPTSSSRRPSRSPASRSSRSRSSRSRPRRRRSCAGSTTGLPQLLGYNGTTAKPAAQTVLVTARDDPLLAQWQYGLGRSVAWTSDSTGRWAKDWLGWHGFSRFFSQLVGWTFPGEETGGIEATLRRPTAARRPLHVESVDRGRLAARLLLDGRRDDGAGPDARRRSTCRRSRRACTRRRSARSTRARTRSGSPRRGRARRRSGRTLGLVAPTAAEYRLLGHERAVPRDAPRGDRRPGDRRRPPSRGRTTCATNAASPTCGRCCSSWRCCCGRSTSRCGGSRSAGASSPTRGAGWPAGSRRSVAPRTAEVAGMIAARERAAGSTARAALLHPAEAAPASTASRANVVAPQPAAVAPPGRVAAPPAPPASKPAPAAAVPTPVDPGPSKPAAAAPTDDGGDTLTRLRDAKRRAQR